MLLVIVLPRMGVPSGRRDTKQQFSSRLTLVGVICFCESTSSLLIGRHDQSVLEFLINGIYSMGLERPPTAGLTKEQGVSMAGTLLSLISSSPSLLLSHIKGGTQCSA